MMNNNRFFDFNVGNIDLPTKFAIFGIPWDSNSSHSNGNARAAPKKIREVTFDLGRITEKGSNVENFDACDFGDVSIYTSLPEKSKENIISFVKEKLPWEISCPIPIMIGGDHYCSFPVIKALNEVYTSRYNKKFGVIIFDAHLDYYDKWLDKESDYHCTVTKRIADISNISSDNIFVIGVRDIDTPELNLAIKENLKYISSYQIDSRTTLKEQLTIVFNHFREKKITDIYISIDIDVLDGSVAPGTGYSIPGGLSYRDLWIAIEEIVNNFNVIGFDMVEVAPNLDTPSNLTLITAAKIIIETMSFILNKNKS